MTRAMTLRINGVDEDVILEPSWRLSYVLRDVLGLTGLKVGCGTGDCGACTVLIDGKARKACRQSLALVEGKKIETIEGLTGERGLHPVQQAFLDCGAFQCGYCTPGMIMETVALFRENPDPTEDDAKKTLNGHLCRCTGYAKIVDAVMLAAERMRGANGEDAQ